MTTDSRPVPGLVPGYEVTSEGRVLFEGLELAPYKADNHWVVSIPTNHITGPPFEGQRRRYARLYELVLLAWHGPRPPRKRFPCFKDGDFNNLRPDNLCWSKLGQAMRYRHAYKRRYGTCPISLARAILEYSNFGYEPVQVSLALEDLGFKTPPERVESFLKDVSHAICRDNGEPL